jgi:hypothetical protein
LRENEAIFIPSIIAFFGFSLKKKAPGRGLKGHHGKIVRG